MKTMIQAMECTSGACGHFTHQIMAIALLAVATSVLLFVRYRKTDE